MGNWILRWIGLTETGSDEDEDGTTSSTTTGQTTSQRVPANDPVADTMNMKCAELMEALRVNLDDESYNSDLQKLKDGNIDGKLFLTLPDKPSLLTKLDLSVGGEAKIVEIIQGIKDGSLKFGQVDSRKLVEPDMPWCTTQTPDDTLNGSGNGIVETDNPGMLKAWISPNTVWPWKDHKELYVEFRQVNLLENWTIGNGQPMNTDTVLLYANTWSNRGDGKIPHFVQATDGKTAQIRVSFNNNQLRNSQLGKRAQNIPAKYPTMNLDLHNGCPDDDYKKHVIIHEFGHALGLGHEHQRSDFWTCIKAYTDTTKMRNDLGLNAVQFTAQWEESADFKMSKDKTEYDPSSIMHYWFKVEWLTHGYSDKKKVERDLHILDDKVANALLGVHKRHETLADKPSDEDIRLLKKVYGDGEGTQTDGTIEQDYDDHVVADAQNPRTRVQGEKKRVAADSSGNSDDTKTGKGSVIDMPAKRQKAPNEEIERMTEQDYDVEVNPAYLNRMEWIEDGKQQVVRIYDASSHKWHEIGENLGIENLISIGRDGHSERDRVTKVLGEWERNACGLPYADKYPRTWRGLLKLLKDSELGQLAEKVHKALLLQKAPNVMVSGPQATVNGQNGGRGSYLSAKDLDTVYNAVIGARSKWYHIGLALGLEADDLDPIKKMHHDSPEECLTDALKRFLQQVSPKPSWKQLADAMASRSVSRGDIAEDLRKQYC